MEVQIVNQDSRNKSKTSEIKLKPPIVILIWICAIFNRTKWNKKSGKYIHQKNTNQRKPV